MTNEEEKRPGEAGAVPGGGVADVANVAGVAAPPMPWQKTSREIDAPKEVDGAAQADAINRVPTGGADRTYGNMQDVIDYLEERKAAIHLPTKEELQRERRRRRTEGIISALADGASAVSNLIFTTQYAPNMYRPEDSLTGKSLERYERWRAQREADADRYLNYALTIGKLKEAQDATAYQRGRDALQDQIMTLKAQNAARLSDIKYRRMAQLITEAQAAAEERDANKDLERAILEAKLEEINSRTRRNDRYQPGGGRSSGQFTVSRKNPQTGKIEYRSGFKSEAAARNFVQTYADQGWVYSTTPTVRKTTGLDQWGEQTTRTSETNVSTQKEDIDWE